jgi:hypothetical protein
MRKYADVDVIAALGAVMELNTESYKGDFRYDIDMFREAATHPDGENVHLLWMSRRYGTQCCVEREAYLIGSYAHDAWTYHADSRSERPLAYAVDIKGIRDGHIIGDIYELDYHSHVKDLKKDALVTTSISATYADGTELHLPYRSWNDNREQLFYRHGETRKLYRHPQDEAALARTIKVARKMREDYSQPAVFKVGIKSRSRPSIKEQLAEGKKQVSQSRPAAPKHTAAKSQGLEI